MFDGIMTEYMAQCEDVYRRKVVHPVAMRREHHARVLRECQEPRPHRRSVILWLGDQLIRLGERLRAETPPSVLPNA
jgi:hypothetical protein